MRPEHYTEHLLYTEDGNLQLEAAHSLISSKTVEQLSNLDQVDHLSTNRTLRDGHSAVDVVYFDFEDLFSSLVPVLKLACAINLTIAIKEKRNTSCKQLEQPPKKRLTENIAREIFADLSQ